MESRRAASSAQREVWGSVAVAAPYGWAASSSAPRPARSRGQQRAADRSSVLHVHSAEGVILGCFGRPARQEWGHLERRWPCYPPAGSSASCSQSLSTHMADGWRDARVSLAARGKLWHAVSFSTRPRAHGGRGRQGTWPILRFPPSPHEGQQLHLKVDPPPPICKAGRRLALERSTEKRGCALLAVGRPRARWHATHIGGSARTGESASTQPPPGGAQQRCASALRSRAPSESSCWGARRRQRQPRG